MVYIIFDLESTCWEEPNIPPEVSDKINDMEVIEIGAIALSRLPDGSWLSLGEYDSFVQPTLHPKLSDFCVELTSITQDDVETARQIEEVFPEFMSWALSFDGEATFVSWGLFDKAIFERMVTKQRKQLDIKYLVRNHFSAKHRARKVGLCGKGLGATLKHLKLSFDGRPHRGIDDARNISKVFTEYFDKIVTEYD